MPQTLSVHSLLQAHRSGSHLVSTGTTDGSAGHGMPLLLHIILHFHPMANAMICFLLFFLHNPHYHKFRLIWGAGRCTTPHCNRTTSIQDKPPQFSFSVKWVRERLWYVIQNVVWCCVVLAVQKVRRGYNGTCGCTGLQTEPTKCSLLYKKPLTVCCQLATCFGTVRPLSCDCQQLLFSLYNYLSSL